ncbi:uncharacterized protein C8Q71DRAFT_173895 [Rhodofomes roseus]|uniref:Uncharacterized protein n=1 Tax=Rhodofomes roseus TaxID=34475 RepID=A0ABQ8KA56_9APHY|nr:uncharacterized protein C8Q71DRAFT_173895 [Rhodofomes roseus]KAH9833765.1 hypothetical protein C8Q71DRAFT_173895 [Rhodofomes roseus]
MWWREEVWPNMARWLWRGKGEKADSFFGIRIWTQLGSIWAASGPAIAFRTRPTRQLWRPNGVSLPDRVPGPGRLATLRRGRERRRCGGERDDEQRAPSSVQGRRYGGHRCGQDRSRASWVMAAYGEGRDACDWLPTGRPGRAGNRACRRTCRGKQFAATASSERTAICTSSCPLRCCSPCALPGRSSTSGVSCIVLDCLVYLHPTGAPRRSTPCKPPRRAASL